MKNTLLKVQTALTSPIWNDDSDEFTTKGYVIIGLIVFVALNVLGYIEGGGLFPWE